MPEKDGLLGSLAPWLRFLFLSFLLCLPPFLVSLLSESCVVGSHLAAGTPFVPGLPLCPGLLLTIS